MFFVAVNFVCTVLLLLVCFIFLLRSVYIFVGCLYDLGSKVLPRSSFQKSEHGESYDQLLS